jgi:hypothetical protein
MTDVTIFLASSIEEFKHERTEIGDFFRVINDCYVERGLYFHLAMCEDMDDAIAQGRKQQEYNQQIVESAFIFFLFYYKTGEYTLEELDVAIDAYRRTGKPETAVFFKKTDTPPDNVRALAQRMGEKGIPCHEYSQINTLKYDMLRYIAKMGLPCVDIQFEDDRATQDDVVLLTLS